MSFLQRGSRLAALPWSQLSLITQRNVPRANLQVVGLQRQLTSRSITCNGLTRPRLKDLEPGRITRTLRRDYNFEPQPPPPTRSLRIPLDRGSPLMASLVVGGLVASCVAATGWHIYVQSNLNPDKALARKWMADFDKNWVLSLRNMDEKRWHTLITSTFMHNGITHLGFNMLCLWGFGKLAARSFGAPRFLLLYFGSGIAGAMLQTWHWRRTEPRYSNPAAIGASGCIFGALGAMTIFSPRKSVIFFGTLPISMWQSSLITVILSLAAIQGQHLPWIGHVDHLGGMAFGVVFYALALRRGRAPRRMMY